MSKSKIRLTAEQSELVLQLLEDPHIRDTRNSLDWPSGAKGWMGCLEEWSGDVAMAGLFQKQVLKKDDDGPTFSFTEIGGEVARQCLRDRVERCIADGNSTLSERMRLVNIAGEEDIEPPRNYADTKGLRRRRAADMALEAAKQADTAFFRLNQSHGSSESYALHLAARALRVQTEKLIVGER